ncbi:MAG: helix-turn-helix transcriptional regulator [Rikenellaceae bacterium]
MKDKITQLMKCEGLTSSRLADILETQPSGISHLVSGRNKPSFDLLQKILRRFPKINPYWLLLDDECMYLCDDDPASVPSTPPPLSLSSDDGDLFTGLPQTEQSNSQKESVAPQPANMPISSTIDLLSPKVKRVIVLYDDNSCESYTVK